MSRRTNTWNAYETKLAGPLPSGSTSVAVESTAGLIDPAYLVVDPDVPTKREWIRVGTITPGLFENIVRNQEGSVGNIDHDTGALVRAVFTKQLQDDLFEDVEDVERAVTDHVNSGIQPDPHPQYLLEDDAETTYVPLGGTQAQLPMTGPLMLHGPPTQDNHASTRLYVDDAVGAVPPQTFLHEDLTDVVPDQHHTKYTDDEAKRAAHPRITYVGTVQTDGNGDFAVPTGFPVDRATCQCYQVSFPATYSVRDMTSVQVVFRAYGVQNNGQVIANATIAVIYEIWEELP